ncbi:MAG: hypothetical protein ABUT20_58505 [Bacteroidota bacterium]
MFTKTDIEKYFFAEKQAGLLFLLIGIAAIITAIVFLSILKMPFYKGASIPLILVGILVGIIGFSVYKRSDADRIRNVYAYDMNPSELKQKELPRMKIVMKSFAIYLYFEIALLVTGVALYIYFIRDFKNDFWRGVGLALAIMSLLALAADFFAEKRGRVYTDGLESYLSKK